MFTEHLPALAGLTVLKTDLWDEAKNTRILAWAGRQGAHAYGVDISAPTVMQARTAFGPETGSLHAAVGDVRGLPFRDASFDAVYSMGTIEHFDETSRAVAEIARVLKTGRTGHRRRSESVRPVSPPVAGYRASGGRTVCVTGALVRPFVFLGRRVPAVRRHGYLFATAVVKPQRAT